MLADARRVAVFAAGIRAYLRSDLTDATLAARLRSDLAQRGERLLAMLDQGVYGRLSSPYRSLLEHAGVERGDVVSLIDEHGVEGALERLRHAGVHVTAEELRGRVPLIRGSLRLDVCAEDFDNPLATGGRLEGITGGTSGTPLRVGLGLGDIGEDIAYIRPWVIGAGLLDSPLVLWRSVPPARSGLRNALRSLRSGLRLESWWSPTPVGLTRGLRDGLALGVARTVVRAHRESIVRPRHAPLHDPAVVLADLARLAAGGRRPVLDATAGAAARLCRTALDNGVSLAGATIRTGGEPLTATKAELIRQVGARASCHYQAHEIGRIGVACCAPVVDDEVHLATGRIAVVEGEDGGAGARLLFTCLSPTSQRLMLNADIGDTAVLARRSCGCPLGQAGLDLHAHTIRAVAKVTAGGTSILHVELLELVERTLPARFGGGPGDYQLVEAEEEGLTRVLVVISPRAGTISEAAVVAAVLDAARAGPAWRRMTAGVWADGAMLRVVRREPYPTAAGKLHAFHRLAS